MVNLAIAKRQRDISISVMKSRQPHRIFMAPDPYHTAGSLDEPMQDYIRNYALSSSSELILACTVSRSSRAQVSGGPAPVDENVDPFDVIIPGGVSGRIRASWVAVAVTNPPTAMSQDPPPTIGLDAEFERLVFTITSINQDWQSYVARMTMEDYAGRR